MRIAFDDAFGGLILLTLIVIALWVIAYSAARAASLRGPEMVPPSFAANAVATAGGVHFTLANLGTLPAFGVAVRWDGLAGGDPIATAEFLSPLAPLEWHLPSPAGESRVVRYLDVRWRTGPQPYAGRRSSSVAVLVPEGIEAG